jgi:hypothetical protein
MRQEKIRVIVKEKNRLTYGVTIPSEFSNWLGALVNITESGCCLILTSGPAPAAFDIKQIKRQGEIIERIKI